MTGKTSLRTGANGGALTNAPPQLDKLLGTAVAPEARTDQAGAEQKDRGRFGNRCYLLIDHDIVDCHGLRIERRGSTHGAERAFAGIGRWR